MIPQIWRCVVMAAMTVALAACNPIAMQIVKENLPKLAPPPERVAPDTTCVAWAILPLEEISPAGTEVRVRLLPDGQGLAPTYEGFVSATGRDSITIARPDTLPFTVRTSRIATVENRVPLSFHSRTFRAVKLGMLVGALVGSATPGE